jgi:hypothetical protein
MRRLLLLAALICVICTISPAISGENAKDITPADLYQAALQRGDIIFSTQSINWWQKFPEFYAGVNPLPGEEFYVVQTFTTLKGEKTLQNAVTCFKDISSAKNGLAELIQDDLKGGTALDGPRLGDESYYTRRNTNIYMYRKEDEPTDVLTLRFRVGRVVARVSAISLEGRETVDNLAAFSAAIPGRIGRVLSGELKAEQLPSGFARVMPPYAAGNAVGPLTGCATVPVEAWSIIDGSGDPVEVKSRLEKGGVNHLVFSNYNIKAAPGNIVDTTLFVFKDAASASDWVQSFIGDKSESKKLDPGKTGKISAFRLFDDGSYYELQFASGRYACQVSGYAPFCETSALCESPVRQLAEMWYAQLSAL